MFKDLKQMLRFMLTESAILCLVSCLAETQIIKVTIYVLW